MADIYFSVSFLLLIIIGFITYFYKISIIRDLRDRHPKIHTQLGFKDELSEDEQTKIEEAYWKFIRTRDYIHLNDKVLNQKINKYNISGVLTICFFALTILCGISGGRLF
jgi:hypothetical protein